MGVNHTTVRRIDRYAEVTESVLSHKSIIRSIARTDIEGSPAARSVRMWVHELTTVANYVPGTGVSRTNDGSNYVVLDEFKEKAVNELLDGYSVQTAPKEYVAQRLIAAIEALGEQQDTDAFVELEDNGTEDHNAAAVKPIATTIYGRILALKEELDKVKAPKQGRWLLMTPEMENLLLDTDSKVVLNTQRGDNIQADGWVGRLLGFDIYSTTLLPSDTNIIAGHPRAVGFSHEWKREPLLQPLDQSGTFIGDSAVQGRYVYVYGIIRPTLLRVDNSAAVAGG